MSEEYYQIRSANQTLSEATFNGQERHPLLPQFPWTGSAGDFHFPLVLADSDFTNAPVPDAVWDIVRVKSWKVEASYVDGNDWSPNDWDFSRSFSDRIIAAGTSRDEVTGTPVIENTPGWESLDDAIILRSHVSPNNSPEAIMGLYMLETDNSETPFPAWVLSFQLRRPTLEFIDGSLWWTLPMRVLPSVPSNLIGLGGLYLSSESPPYFPYSVIDRITVLGEEVEITSLPTPEQGGWSVEVSVNEYF
jgi:hypothetical protein